MSSSVAIGLDVGEVRIGVAEGSTIARIARPHSTLAASTFAVDFAKLCGQVQPDIIVIGFPRNMSGEETKQTDFVRAFAKEQVESASAAQIVWQDESLTSVRAEDELSSRGAAYTKGDIDALAATYILQDYFDAMDGLGSTN